MENEGQNNNSTTQGSGNGNVSLGDLGLGANDLGNSSTKPENEGNGAGVSGKENTTITETPEQKLVKEQVGKLSDEDKTKYNSLSDIEKTNFLKEKSSNSENSNNQKAEIKAVEIDGREYKLNEKGDAIDEKGNVVKTKSEIEKLVDEQQANEEPLIITLAKLSGITPKDDKGNPIQYEDTEEGIIKWANDIATIKAQALHDNYLKQFPDVAEYAKARQQGKTAEEYFKKQATSWSNTKLDGTDKEQLKSVIIDSFIKDGWSKADAEKTTKMYEDSDQLKTFGEAAYNKLVKSEKAALVAEEENYNQKVIEYNENVVKHWNNVKATVDKGTIGNISIPESERENFFKYIATSSDEQGNSARDIAYSKLSTEDRLQLDYLLYKGLNLKSLIENSARTQNAQGLKLRLKGKTGASEGVGNQVQTKGNVEISMDNF